MALFGFGKKKEEKKRMRDEEKKVILNRRAYPRYMVEDFSTNLGEAIDISCNSISIAMQKSSLEEGDSVELVIDKESFKAKVKRKTVSKVVLTVQPLFPLSLIERHKKKIQDHFFEFQKKFDTDVIIEDENLHRNRAIINLMLEIEDPNTNIEKLSHSIELLADLKEKILNCANSIENARGGYVENISGAVSRLGFDTLKEIIYEYINMEVNLSNPILENFENFEIMHLFQGAFFKKIAPLFSFNDIKSEGQSLLNMSYVGATILATQSKKLKEYYKSPKELYSFEMRFLEKKETGIDLLELDRYYFVDTLNVFFYLYDGFVLANIMLCPHYDYGMKILLSQRKMRYSYVVYLTLLALRYLLSHDRESATILYRRMNRLGFDVSETKALLQELVEDINEKLKLLDEKKRFVIRDVPLVNKTLESFFGTGIYLDYITQALEDFDKKTKRVAFRYSDRIYTHILLEKILNYEDLELSKEPFCVIPCDRIEDDDLPLEQFTLFDVLVFKDIDRLPDALQKDFEKIWRDFEGKIVITLSEENFIEISNTTLYTLVRDYLVDIPTYFQNEIIEMKMVNHTANSINEFFGEKVCNIGAFKGKLITASTLYLKCFKE